MGEPDRISAGIMFILGTTIIATLLYGTVTATRVDSRI